MSSLRSVASFVLLTALVAVTPANAQEETKRPGMTISISAATKDKHGFLVHEVESPFQKGKTKIFVLTPDKIDKHKRFPVVYVLPVESGTRTSWGHALLEIKQLNLHNKLGVIFVMPTFSHLPWYCDHPTDPTIRQESYLLKVVIPFIETTYPARKEAKGRMLLGFSKSGWGAFSMLLRNPDVFGRAAAWDAPLTISQPNSFGMGPIFGTQKNFERYRISKLLQQKSKHFRESKRLGIVGYSRFRRHHRELHEQLVRLKIPHVYKDVRQGKHHWNSGWIDDAVQFLMARSSH